MRVVRYLSRGPDPHKPPCWFYGTPVDVVAHWGDLLRVVYQFHTFDSQPAVVHWPTGMLVVGCIDPEDLPGTYQQQAQRAVDRRLAKIDRAKYESVVASHPVINEVLIYD